MNKTQKTVSLAIGSAFALSIAATSINAAENPFALKALSSGYQVADSHDTKAKDGKCGAGKCGANMKKEKAKEGACSAAKMKKEKAKEGACSAAKMKEGACSAEKMKQGDSGAGVTNQGDAGGENN